VILSLAFALLLNASPPKTVADDLATGFKSPPPSARPHTWWHWLNGNVTEAGITADLEAMKQVGIGGAQMFTVDQGIPAGPAKYMSPLWRHMTAFAVKEASRLGIELCIANCAGWSSSGGPWVTPEQAMQVVAWSEKKVHGPMAFSEQLPKPKAPQVDSPVDYYRDIAVYAYKTPAEGDVPAKQPDNFLGKTGVNRQDGLEPDLNPGVAGMAIPKEGLVMLTQKMDASGHLTWDVPEGDWTILRVGHTPTGVHNHPAPPEADGLEVDKMSKEALDAHWSNMMAKVIADAGPLAGKVLNNSLIDSYEVGSQNWTPKFREEFQKRRGYDPLPYLPVITGRTIESKEISERFLWDLRRTIADLFAENYYGHLGELCHKNGMMFSAEPYGNGGFDNIQSGSKEDIPMAEFWVGGGTLETTKLASSVGHVYGRPIIGAESFTADDVRGRWLEEPYMLKTLGDKAFCNGINRYIFHRYAMQPWTNLNPGMTMGPWGTHLERTQTWWTEAAAWMKYIARCQYLLQKGRFVADALYFNGENGPSDLPYQGGLKPQLPDGFDYDGCDAHAISMLKVQNGNLVLPSGMTYKILILPQSEFMTPEMAAKIDALVRAGAIVVGPKPLHTPSLSGFPTSERKLHEIADGLWGNVEPSKDSVLPGRNVGKGAIFWGGDLRNILPGSSIESSFQVYGAMPRTKIAHIHRTIDGNEVYFVSNQRYENASFFAAFQGKGLTPEFWHADTGVMEPVPVYYTHGIRTEMPIHLGPAESVFVVFRHTPALPHWSFFRSDTKQDVRQKEPVIEIRKARYEADSGKGADVTDTVRDLIRTGNYEIGVTNETFGDPAVNVVKHLHIDFSVDGKPFTKDVPENDTLIVFEGPGGSSALPSFELHETPKGLAVTAWTAGKYIGSTQAYTNTYRLLGTPDSFNPDGFWGGYQGYSDKPFADGGPQIVPGSLQIEAKEPEALSLTGSWSVTFPPNLGAPASATFDSLGSWTENSEPGVKYFSGSATYHKEFDVPANMVGTDVVQMLDLGVVKNFATVKLNGKDLGVLWKAPFAVDVTGALRAGKNTLEIKVTNLWPNRLIGDEQFPPDVTWQDGHLKEWPEWLLKGQPRPQTGRIAFATWHFYNKDSKLLDSGLIGPVVIRAAKQIFIKPKN